MLLRLSDFSSERVLKVLGSLTTENVILYDETLEKIGPRRMPRRVPKAVLIDELQWASLIAKAELTKENFEIIPVEDIFLFPPDRVKRILPQLSPIQDGPEEVKTFSVVEIQGKGDCWGYLMTIQLARTLGLTIPDMEL